MQPPTHASCQIIDISTLPCCYTRSSETIDFASNYFLPSTHLAFFSIMCQIEHALRLTGGIQKGPFSPERLFFIHGLRNFVPCSKIPNTVSVYGYTSYSNLSLALSKHHHSNTYLRIATSVLVVCAQFRTPSFTHTLPVFLHDLTHDGHIDRIWSMVHQFNICRSYHVEGAYIDCSSSYCMDGQSLVMDMQSRSV